MESCLEDIEEDGEAFRCELVASFAVGVGFVGRNCLSIANVDPTFAGSPFAADNAL